MNLMIRTDASHEIGIGHVMRCLTLADEVSRRGVSTAFICRELDGNLCSFIENKGYKVYRLPYIQDVATQQDGKLKHSGWLGATWDTDADANVEILCSYKLKVNWFVVDHYAIDEKWESRIKPYVEKLIVVDDLADRVHKCDIIIDQNYYENYRDRYNGLVPPSCIKLLGIEYALLRSEFTKNREMVKQKMGMAKRILVFFGGSDPTNETMKVIDSIQLLDSNINFDIVVGASNKNKETIEMKCKSLSNVKYHYQVDNMSQLMLNADLAIGAGGATTWERCYLGLPCLVIKVAYNQFDVIENVKRTGAIIDLGYSSEVSAKIIAEKINEAISKPYMLNEMRKEGMKLVDGLGAERIIKIMELENQ